MHWFVRFVMKHPDSTYIMKSHRWIYAVGERWWRFIWLCLRFKYNIVFQVIWIYPVIQDGEILRCLCAWLCGFTTSSMTGSGLKILISIHESSESRVKCLYVVSYRSLTCEKWIINFNRHLMVWEIV